MMGLVDPSYRLDSEKFGAIFSNLNVINSLGGKVQ